ncbi:hypothetical protein [Algivirga pacifica]|uniref:Uncharacterized protein n=1 Tax=Algivirga pacifica TaxID=1162670 RepID=A0ABP9DIC6_9BACT
MSLQTKIKGLRREGSVFKVLLEDTFSSSSPFNVLFMIKDMETNRIHFPKEQAQPAGSRDYLTLDTADLADIGGNSMTDRYFGAKKEGKFVIIAVASDHASTADIIQAYATEPTAAFKRAYLPWSESPDSVAKNVQDFIPVEMYGIYEQADGNLRLHMTRAALIEKGIYEPSKDYVLEMEVNGRGYAKTIPAKQMEVGVVLDEFKIPRAYIHSADNTRKEIKAFRAKLKNGSNSIDVPIIKVPTKQANNWGGISMTVPSHNQERSNTDGSRDVTLHFCDSSYGIASGLLLGPGIIQTAVEIRVYDAKGTARKSADKQYRFFVASEEVSGENYGEMHFNRLLDGSTWPYAFYANLLFRAPELVGYDGFEYAGNTLDARNQFALAPFSADECTNAHKDISITKKSSTSSKKLQSGYPAPGLTWTPNKAVTLNQCQVRLISYKLNKATYGSVHDKIPNTQHNVLLKNKSADPSWGIVTYASGDAYVRYALRVTNDVTGDLEYIFSPFYPIAPDPVTLTTENQNDVKHLDYGEYVRLMWDAKGRAVTAKIQTKVWGGSWTTRKTLSNGSVNTYNYYPSTNEIDNGFQVRIQLSNTEGSVTSNEEDILTWGEV